MLSKEYLTVSWYLVAELFNGGAAASRITSLLQHQLGILQQRLGPSQVSTQALFHVCYHTKQAAKVTLTTDHITASAGCIVLRCGYV